MNKISMASLGFFILRKKKYFSTGGSRDDDDHDHEWYLVSIAQWMPGICAEHSKAEKVKPHTVATSGRLSAHSVNTNSQNHDFCQMQNYNHFHLKFVCWFFSFVFVCRFGWLLAKYPMACSQECVHLCWRSHRATGLSVDCRLPRIWQPHVFLTSFRHFFLLQILFNFFKSPWICIIHTSTVVDPLIVCTAIISRKKIVCPKI